MYCIESIDHNKSGNVSSSGLYGQPITTEQLGDDFTEANKRFESLVLENLKNPLVHFRLMRTTSTSRTLMREFLTFTLK
jgi:hypothetical protein